MRIARGQAMIETVVALILLIPLWLAVLFLAELLATQQSAISSVRHALMLSHQSERGLDTDAIKDLARSRFSPKAIDAPWMPDALKFDIQLDAVATLPAAKQLRGLADGVLQPATLVTGGDFGLPSQDDARIVATISYRLPQFLGTERRLEPVLLSERTAALQQVWYSRGDIDTERRVRGVAMQGRLVETSRVFDAIRPVISIVEPAFERFCPGRLDVDIVPADRTNGANGGDARARSC